MQGCNILSNFHILGIIDCLNVYVCLYFFIIPSNGYPFKVHDPYFSSGVTHNSLFLIQGSLNKFPDFFCMGTFIDSKHIKLFLWSNLFWLQCTCCTVPTTSERPHGSPLVWACQWLSSQPLSSPHLSHNDSLWA